MISVVVVLVCRNIVCEIVKTTTVTGVLKNSACISPQIIMVKLMIETKICMTRTAIMKVQVGMQRLGRNDCCAVDCFPVPYGS